MIYVYIPKLNMQGKASLKVLVFLLCFFIQGRSLTAGHYEQEQSITLPRAFDDQTPKLFLGQMGCSRKNRQNIIQVQNLLQKNTVLRMRGVYTSEGSINNELKETSQLKDKPGQYEINSGHTTFWIFNSDNILSGTAGLMVWEVMDKEGYGLVLFFKNPKKDWNNMGLCIQKIDDIPLSQTTQAISNEDLKTMFEKFDGMELNWGSNCIHMDNRQTKEAPYFRQGVLNKYGYNISALGKYEYEVSDSRCFFQYLTVVIGAKQ